MLGVFTVMSAVPSRETAHFCVCAARILAERGRRTLLIDLCAEHPMLDLALGVGEKVLYTVRDVLNGSVPLENALISPLRRTKKGTVTEDGILLLAGDVTACPTGESVRALLEQATALSADAVLVLADARTQTTLREVTDAALLFTDGSEESLRALLPLCEAGGPVGVILSHFMLTAEAVNTTIAPRALADALGAPVVGILPHSAARTVGDKTSREFLAGVTNVTRRLMGENVPLLYNVSVDGMRKRKYLER